jgi:hypothetical protein
MKIEIEESRENTPSVKSKNKGMKYMEINKQA